MARTKRAKRERPGLRPSRSGGNRRMVWVNSSRKGWRPRRRQIVATGLAKICDDERLKDREKTLDVVEVRGSVMPVAPLAFQINAAVAACLLVGLSAALCPQVLRGLFMVGIPFAVAIFASTSLGDLRVLQPKTRIEFLYERTAPWLPGESTEERDARRAAPCAVSAVDCHPEEVPGRVISTQMVEPGYRSFTHMADKDRLVGIGYFTDSEITALRNRTSKIDPATELPIPMTPEDRYGAIMPQLVDYYGTRDAVLAKEYEADFERREAELDPETTYEPNDFDLQVRRLRKALPRTITHTGTGMYWVKVTPTLHNDTQSGAPVGQTVNLTTGGLGVNAFIGGYITNTSRSETRAIVSNAAGSAVLEGSLTNWLDTDTLEVYDAWATWAAANAQLFTDQGTATFASLQYVRGFAGTYTETITPSSSLNPSEADGYMLVLEGDASDSRANIIIQPSTGGALSLGCDQGLIRHIRIIGSSNATALTIGTGCTWAAVRDCQISSQDSRLAIYPSNDYTEVSKCAISAGSTGVFFNGFAGGKVMACTIDYTGTATARHGVGTNSSGMVVVEGCAISNYDLTNCSGVYSVTSYVPLRTVNNTLYNCTHGVWNAQGADIVGINNIFDSCTYVYRCGFWPDESGEGRMGGKWTLRNNCYKAGYTGFAYNGSSTKTAAEFAAFDLVDAAGELVDTDPLLTDPANGDFSLDTGSPCINTGHGSGVIMGYNGVAFDPNNPDIGAYSTGVFVANPPTWTANTSNIVATDAQTSGEVKLTWDAATPGTGDVGYIVESRTAAGPGAWGEDARTIVNGTALDPFVAGALANGVERDFRVKAYSRVIGEPTTTPTDTDSATPTAPGVPDAPQITATDLLNQSDVRVDVVAGDPADVSTIYYQIRPDGALQTWGTPVTGSGSETLTGLLVKPYVIYAVPTRGGCTGDPSNLAFLTVQAANQYTNIRTALREWIKGVVGNPEVIWREPNASQPLRPYVSIKMNATTVVGHDYHSGADSNGIETVEGTREFVFSVRVHGKPAQEDKGEANSIIERIRSSLELRSVQATLSAAGLSFVVVDGSSDLAGIGGTEFESQSFIDIRFRTTYSDDDDVGYIGTAVPTGTYEGG